MYIRGNMATAISKLTAQHLFMTAVVNILLNQDRSKCLIKQPFVLNKGVDEIKFTVDLHDIQIG